MARAAPPPALESVASVVHRLAVLLAGGVSPVSSWSYLAELPRGPATAMLETIGEGARSGTPVAEVIIDALDAGGSVDDQAWRGLAAAWKVATEAGAPLATTLQAFAASLRSIAQIQRDLHSALAGPVATARVVMVLPAVGVVFGMALGFDTLGTLFTTPPGQVCVVLGAMLILAARGWNARLLAAAAVRDLTPGLELDLMAIAVSGGASIPRARGTVAEARAACGLAMGDSEAAITEVLELSRRAGVPAAALLRSEADELRRAAKSDGERRAATLAVTLMLPLGICVLPAFMLLGVAPLMIAVVSSTIGTG